MNEKKNTKDNIPDKNNSCNMEEKLKIRRVNYFLKKCPLANYNNIGTS